MVLETKTSSSNGPMLKLKSFKEYAKICLNTANKLRNQGYEMIPRIENDADVSDPKLLYALEKLTGIPKEKAASLGAEKFNLFLVNYYSSLLPSVIGQCKSGCMQHDKMIDVKLESHIDKRSFHKCQMRADGDADNSQEGAKMGVAQKAEELLDRRRVVQQGIDDMPLDDEDVEVVDAAAPRPDPKGLTTTSSSARAPATATVATTAAKLKGKKQAKTAVPKSVPASRGASRASDDLTI